MCGEKPPSGGSPARFSGSPPRVRGKVPKRSAPAGAAGITPACAGKRIWFLDNSILARDHPRVCGEKRLYCQFTFLSCGITPACAGKSWRVLNRNLERGDHPRVCGEKALLRLLTAGAAGSPPRVRGKERNCPLVSWYLGITPACAGKRLKRSHSIGHFSCILCLFHSVLHRASVSGGSRAGPCAPPCLPAQNAVPV